MNGTIQRIWDEEFSAERARDFDLPRAGNYTLADIDHGDGTETYGLVVAGPYETPEDARIAGRMLAAGETPCSSRL